MFLRETKETENNIERMFHQVRQKMKQKVTLKKKSDHEMFVVSSLIGRIDYHGALGDTCSSVNILPKVMTDQLGVKIKPSEDSFSFVDCSKVNSRGIIKNLQVQIGKALVPMNFHAIDIKIDWNSFILLGRAFRLL
ncbi:hypothetical protein DY000_02020825 [Brassica cretica]|uniref:Xylanase inhibitor C-terminal domain-containing protein n=1 Tax=Brassica cretica TaxID=69181 RepID=A0ABQ7EMK3_BRACR|nr:hypothetical protein DY000_02020825 [Brassica cretica]